MAPTLLDEITTLRAEQAHWQVTLENLEIVRAQRDALLEAAKELVDIVDNADLVDYDIDSFTTQPMRAAIEQAGGGDA